MQPNVEYNCLVYDRQMKCNWKTKAGDCKKKPTNPEGLELMLDE